MSSRKFSFLPATAALACAALFGAPSLASAQDAPSYGTDGAPHRIVKLHRDRMADRTLTVRRRYAEPPVAALPPPPPPAGPGAIVAAPVRAASAVVDLPFRVLNGIFPATGSEAANPLVLIGAPIRAAGAIAQVPFHMMEAVLVPQPYGTGGHPLF